MGTIKRNGLDIKDVSYVKGLKFHPLSVNQLCDKGYTMEFNRHVNQSVENNKIMLSGKHEKNIYLVD